MAFTFAYPVFDISKNKKGKTILTQQSGRYTASGGTYYTNSIYYYWFIFYQLSQTHSWSMKIPKSKQLLQTQKDFGSVKNKTFKEWWFEKVGNQKRGEYLFANKQIEKVEVITAIKKDSNMLNVSIPLTLPKRSITRQIRAVINKHHTAKRGNVKKADRVKALYTPTNNKVRAYEKLLLLAEMLEKHKDKTNKQIWFECLKVDKNFSSVNATSINIDSINTAMSRATKKLSGIFTNVQIGKF